jgi:hypothetical protein
MGAIMTERLSGEMGRKKGEKKNRNQGTRGGFNEEEREERNGGAPFFDGEER